ncbi:arylamine N-acetyltransferase [Lysinibacillus sp. MHQ-1]|nr:arylamine N-acetyltransferase [Lysinibacillus sp. MHQ-1]
MNAQIQQYLQHIQFQGTLEPTVQLLGQLQTKHLLTIPYENLDVALNLGISFSIPDLFQKIIIERRGGQLF